MLLVICDSAHAEREVSWSKDRNTLIVREITVTKIDSIPDVPTVLSKEVAESLYVGLIEKFIIKDETGEKTSSFSLPCIKSETTYRDKEVTYSNKWIIQDSTESVLRYDDYLLSFVWLWMPAFLITVISIVSIVWRDNIKRVLIFYTSMLIAVILCALVGGITGSIQAGLFVGILIGGVVGASSGGLATERPPIDPVMGSKRIDIGAMIMGGGAGAFASMIAGSLASEQNYKIIEYYLLFLLGVEAISFVISFAYAEQQRARAGLKAEIESETPE